MAWAQLLAAAGFVMLAGASFFFALAETALFTLGKWQVRQISQQDSKSGKVVETLLAAPQDLLATIVLGNTVANAGLVAIGVWGVQLNPVSGWLVLPGVLAVILVIGEVIPKTLAVRDPDFWAALVARLMQSLVRLTRPGRVVAQRLNAKILGWFVPLSVKPVVASPAEDHTELFELGFQRGALGEGEKEILLQIISLGQRTVSEVMKPRAQMACLPDTLPVEEMIEAARRLKHRRLPLYDGTPDTIVGVLNTRLLLLHPENDIAEAIEFPSFVPETMNLLVLLKSLQRQQRGLAIVLDEYGGTAGVVSTEDILGSMIGGIRGEDEVEGFLMEKLAPGRWRVNGTTRLDDFRREYPALGEVPEIETMGGLLVAQAGVVPPQGHQLVFRGLRLTAKAADERRVRELLVEEVRKGGSAPS